jgi:ribonuclease R
MGDKVTIKVVAANLEKRQLDYELILGHWASTEGKVLQQTKGKTKKTAPKTKRSKK